MENMHEHIDSSRKAYAAPRLKLYGSVLALTAGGTGMTVESGMMGTPGMPGPCWNGMDQGGQSIRKHCL